MELWDLYDANRQPLNRTWPRGQELPEGTYHIVIGVWTWNSAGEILLTLRHPEKEIWPDTWENTGGSILAGETSAEGAARELFEETGIAAEASELSLLGTNLEASAIIDTYFLHRDVDIADLTMQEGETTAARWVTLEELYAMAADGRLAGPVAERLYLLQEEFEKQLGVLTNQRRRRSASSQTG